MKYMIDTNICIYAIKDQFPGLRSYMANIAVGDMVISSVTLSELRYGAYKSEHTEKNLVAINQFLATIRVLSYDDHAADEYGRIRGCTFNGDFANYSANLMKIYDTVITGVFYRKRATTLSNVKYKRLDTYCWGLREWERMVEKWLTKNAWPAKIKL